MKRWKCFISRKEEVWKRIRIVMTSLPDMMNLRFLCFFRLLPPRNDFWLRCRILWRIRRRDCRSLQLYYRESLCSWTICYQHVNTQTYPWFPPLFALFSYVKLTLAKAPSDCSRIRVFWRKLLLFDHACKVLHRWLNNSCIWVLQACSLRTLGYNFHLAEKVVAKL